MYTRYVLHVLNMYLFLFSFPCIVNCFKGKSHHYYYYFIDAHLKTLTSV